MANSFQTAALFIILLNVLVWLSSIAMININPFGTVCYNLEGSIIGETVEGTNDNLVVSNDVIDDLPNAEGVVSAGDSTNIFTDIFNNVLGWFKTAPGLRYIYGVVAAPYNILKCMNLPTEFVVGIGTFWYLITLLSFLAFLWGRQ